MNVRSAVSSRLGLQRCFARTDFVASKTSISMRLRPGLAAPFKDSRPDTLPFMLSTRSTNGTRCGGWLGLTFFAWPRVVQRKTSVLILGSRRPVGPMTDCNHELGYWLRGAPKLWVQHNRGARHIRTPNLGIC